MRISKDKYYKDMARVLLRGYFEGLKCGKKMCKIEFTKGERGYRIKATKKR